MKHIGLHLRTILLLVCTARADYGYTYPESTRTGCPYGESCLFEPSPPGRAPLCAQPGLTYCVHPDPYPERIIRKLIEAGQYDIRTLLSDETRENFEVKKKSDYPYGYGPNSIPNVDQISLVNDGLYPKNYNTKFHTRFNHDIFSHKTPLQPPSQVDPTPYIKTFQATNYTNFGFQGFHTSPTNGYWKQQTFDSYGQKLIKQNTLPQNFGGYYHGPTFNPNYDSTDWYKQAVSSVGVTQYNPTEWWKYTAPTAQIGRRRRRNAQLVEESRRRKLTGEEALRIALGLANEETSAERPRRQAPNTEELCRVRSEFITPRAALNNKGDWKYIVNMPQNMTQLVKTEICTSTECSGLCSVPLGYTTRCQQKYIQKRLVALQGNGQNLYTDVFWIPSCCQCTIIAN